ncbi:Perilipin-3, partial [Merops nubicus]
QQSVVSRVANLPLVSSACGVVSTAYSSTKERHPYVRSPRTAAGVSGAQPLLTKLEPQSEDAVTSGVTGVPLIQRFVFQLLSDTKQLVTSTVTGARDVLSSTVAGARDAVTSGVTGVDITRGAVQGGLELTRSAVSSGVSTVMGSTVGQMLVSGVGSVLEKSEELVDHYLPMTD